MTPSPDLAILCHLATRTSATASEIGTACRMTAEDVRAHLVMLDLRGLVSGRPDKTTVPPSRVYVVTGEGRRAAGISDVRMNTPQRDNVTT